MGHVNTTLLPEEWFKSLKIDADNPIVISKVSTGLSGVCAVMLGLSFFPPNISAQPIISVSGPPAAWVVLYNGQAFAASWTQTNAATDVGVLVQLSSFGMPDQTGRAYLTSTLGPGTTTAQEIASATFGFPLQSADVVLFSGLTLGPGTYYLTLVGDSGSWGSGWLSGCPSSVVAADGAMVGLNYGFSGFAPYLPASSVWSQPFIFTRFSVASVPNGGIFSSASIHTNDTFVAQPGEPVSATNQTATVIANAPQSLILSAHDPEGSLMNLWVDMMPTHGTLSIRGVGPLTELTCYGFTEVVYTPAPNFTGTDSFRYLVSDGASSASATVTVNVVPANNPPSAIPQAVATEFGVPVSINLSGSDPDGDPIEFTVTTGPAHGTLAGSGATKVYTPAAGFSGLDEFSFVVDDGQADSQPAVVSITVAAEDAPPFAPVNLVATAVGHDIRLSWSDRSSAERGFRIERAVGNGAFKQVSTVAANVETFIDGGVQPGKSYSYRVRAYNKNGNSAYSNVATVTAL